MGIAIIGVDCATISSNVGISLADIDTEVIRLLDVSIGMRDRAPADQILQWIQGRQSVLLALDAPLGWPVALSRQLYRHVAGSSIGHSPDRLFRRETDRYVEEVIGKRPLEVGADRIARTTVAALNLLADLGQRLGKQIPLAWSHVELPILSAIEVYPAATLRSRSLKSEGYKDKKGLDIRKGLFEAIAGELRTELDPMDIVANDNVFDAVLCALAGIDFVRGRAIEPPDRETATKEGWIWFARPDMKDVGEISGDA